MYSVSTPNCTNWAALNYQNLLDRLGNRRRRILNRLEQNQKDEDIPRFNLLAFVSDDQNTFAVVGTIDVFLVQQDETLGQPDYIIKTVV